MSSTSSSTTTATALSPRIYGLQAILIAMLVLIAGGAACWFFYTKLDQQVRVTDDTRTRLGKTQQELTNLKSATEAIPEQQEEQQRSINELERVRDETAAQLEDTNKQLQQLRLQTSSQQIEHDRQLARLAKLRYLGQQIQGDLDALETEHTDWKKQRDSLLTNLDGTRIAADPEDVALFDQVSSGEPFPESQLANWREQWNHMFHTVQSLPDETADVQAPAGYLDEVNSLAESVRSALDQVQRKNSVVKGLLEKTKDVRPGSSAISLTDALEEHHRRAQEELLRQAMLAAKDVGEEYVQKLAAEKQQTYRELGEAEIRLEREQRQQSLQAKEFVSQQVVEAMETARVTALQRQANVVAQRQREVLRNEYEAALPEISRYLVPFIEPGHKQLNGSQWVYADEPVPLSLNGLRASHALDNTQMGYQSLSYIAGGRVNDRPRGMFHEYIGGHVRDGEIPLVRRAQNLLQKFGDLMVEDKKLMP